MTTSSITKSTLNQFNPLRHPVKFVLTLLTIFVIYTVWLATHLDIGKEPQEADVIIVPGGELMRDIKGAQLLKEGYSRSNKMISSPLNEYYQGKPLIDHLTETAGLSPDQIVPEFDATSTWTNATTTVKLMEENNWQSAIVLTTDYHTRRTRLAYERAARGKNLTFYYVSAYYTNDQGNPISYLKTPYRWKIIWSEIYKSYGYYLGLYHLIDL